MTLNLRHWLRTLWRWWSYTRHDTYLPVKREWRYSKNGEEL